MDAEVNLVPFIDLLSMCICFLLMTAIWMEIGALQVKQAVGTEAPAAHANSYEMDLRFVSSTKMELAIKNSGRQGQKFVVEGASPDERLSRLDVVLAGIGTLFKPLPGVDLKTQFGQIFSVARVTTKTGVPYGELISVMDALRNHGIVNLGVVPVRE